MFPSRRCGAGVRPSSVCDGKFVVTLAILARFVVKLVSRSSDPGDRSRFLGGFWKFLLPPVEGRGDYGFTFF